MRALLTVLLLFYINTAMAGDWLLSSGYSALSLGYSYTSSEKNWDEKRQLYSSNCVIRDQALSMRYEYGYSYYHTLFASSSFNAEHCGNDDTSGIADVRLGMRGRMNPFRNSYAWEFSLILPVQGDALNNKTGTDQVGLEAGLFRSYRPDPYEKLRYVYSKGVWGWGLGASLWNRLLDQQVWGQLTWSHPVGSLMAFKANLSGTKSVIIEELASDTNSNERRRYKDYDIVSLGMKLSGNINTDYRLGLSLKQDVWGRNTSRDTTLGLDLNTSWD